MRASWPLLTPEWREPSEMTLDQLVALRVHSEHEATMATEWIARIEADRLRLPRMGERLGALRELVTQRQRRCTDIEDEVVARALTTFRADVAERKRRAMR